MRPSFLFIRSSSAYFNLSYFSIQCVQGSGFTPNSTKFISHKDLKALTSYLKKIYKAAIEEIALAALDDLDDRWAKKYPLAVKSWRNNWSEIANYLKYPEELRRII